MRRVLLFAAGVGVAGGTAACRQSAIEGEVGAADAGTGGEDEVWLAAGCDMDRRLRDEVTRLEGEGVVPVHGVAGYAWDFSCDGGGTLRMEVATLGAEADGDPVLWLGAATDPPRLVPIRLQVGAGQTELERLLTDPDRPEPQILAVDLASGVVWRP